MYHQYHHRLFPIRILGDNQTSQPGKMESLHFSERPAAQLDHINRLVEMVIDFHSLIIGHSDGLINHRPEFPVSGIPKRVRKISGTPVFTSVIILFRFTNLVSL